MLREVWFDTITWGSIKGGGGIHYQLGAGVGGMFKQQTSQRIRHNLYNSSEAHATGMLKRASQDSTIPSFNNYNLISIMGMC